MHGSFMLLGWYLRWLTGEQGCESVVQVTGIDGALQYHFRVAQAMDALLWSIRRSQGVRR